MTSYDNDEIKMVECVHTGELLVSWNTTWPTQTVRRYFKLIKDVGEVQYLLGHHWINNTHSVTYSKRIRGTHNTFLQFYLESAIPHKGKGIWAYKTVPSNLYDYINDLSHKDRDVELDFDVPHFTLGDMKYPLPL